MFGESSEPEPSHPPPLHEIRLWNFYQATDRTTTSIGEQIRPTLTVERNGEVVHQGTYALPEEGSNIFSISNEDWLGCGRYEATTGLQNESHEATIDSGDFEPAEVVDGEIQPIRLDIAYHPKTIEPGAVPLDEPRVRCKGETTGTEP